MLKLALFARLEAKAGKEDLRIGPSTFGIFDAFADESGRQAHLQGPIAKALMAKAPELFSQTPSIEKIDVLGVKLPK